MPLEPVRIETPRLLLRPCRLPDAAVLHQLVKAEHESLKNYFPYTLGHNSSLPASRNFIKTRLAEMNAGKSAFLGIFEKPGEQLIGEVTIKDIDWRIPKAELAYFIATDKRGTGLGSEAVNAVCEFCFEKAGIIKLLLRIENINTASRRVAEKCGFTLSGTLRSDFRAADGRLMDCDVWERLK